MVYKEKRRGKIVDNFLEKKMNLCIFVVENKTDRNILLSKTKETRGIKSKFTYLKTEMQTIVCGICNLLRMLVIIAHVSPFKKLY